MRCDWANDPNAPVPCRVVNLDTGRQIPDCAMADEETGEYVRYVVEHGRFKLGTDRRVATVSGKARLAINLLAPGESYFAGLARPGELLASTVARLEAAVAALEPSETLATGLIPLVNSRSWSGNRSSPAPTSTPPQKVPPSPLLEA